MKRSIPLFLALLLSLTAPLSAQEAMDLDRLVERRGVYLRPQTLEPYSGPVVSHWPSGLLREKGRLVDGRWDGVRESYYELGTLEARETYENGVLDGPFETFFRKGAPSDKGTYENGRLDGHYESFWLREPAEIGEFDDGRMCGDWTRYFPRSSYGLRVESRVSHPACSE